MAGGRQKGTIKTGGRVKGSRNKANPGAHATLAKVGLDPFNEAIKVYQGKVKFETVITDPKTGKRKVAMLPASEQTRFRALVELIKRQYPELKSMEFTGPEGSELPAVPICVYFGPKPE